MRHERIEHERLKLSQALAECAAEQNRTGASSALAFDVLQGLSHIGSPPIQDDRTGDLLRLLARQPSPDGTMALLGRAIAGGQWMPRKAHGCC